MSDLEELLAFQVKLAKLPVPEREWRFGGLDGRRRWRMDFAWPDAMVAAEVDGGTFVNGGHNRGTQIESDAQKLSEAVACGWRCMRFTASMVRDGRALDLLERVLRPAQQSLEDAETPRPVQTVDTRRRL